MAINWKEALADKAKYPDSTVFNGPDGPATFGEIRAGYIERERQLDLRAGEQAANARAIDAARTELADVYKEFQKRSEELAAREAVAAAAPAQNRQYEDAYLDPVKEEVAALKAQLAESKKNVELVLANQKDMATRYMTLDWDHAMKEIGSDLPDGVDEKMLLKFAVDNNIKDRAGLPDIRKAFNVVTEPARRKKEIEDAEERGRRKERESILAGKLGRPATMRIPPKGKGAAKQFDSMDEAITEGAASDPEILRIFDQEMGGEI